MFVHPVENDPERLSQGLTHDICNEPATRQKEPHKMTTLLLNSFLVLITLFFAAMAFYPLFITGDETEANPKSIGEDRVISVVPMGLEKNRPIQIGPATADEDRGEHPGHPTAA